MDLRCARIEEILPDEAAYRAAYGKLPGWRRRKCDKFRFADDRRRSVAAWELLRRMLGAKGVRAESLTVTENEFGKPAFDPPIGLHFSISHAGERVMAAVAETEVGCDVERIVPVDDGMLGACLAADELTRLAAFSGPERDRAFVRLWVRKESYAKAIGKGLVVGFPAVLALDSPPEPGWAWRDYDYGDGYLGCAAVRVLL